MLDWRPSISSENLRLRAGLLAQARKFFSDGDILEVETPLLGAFGVTDPALDSFDVSIEGDIRFLQTSPEFAMKRILAVEARDIYQICKSFRRRETGAAHNPEFTLIEWYRLGYSLQQMMQETAEFICMLLSSKDPVKEIFYLSYSDASRHVLGESILDIPDSRLEQVAVSHGLVVGDVVSRNQLYDFIFSHCIAPTFDSNRITVVFHYPASQASLAKLEEGNPALSQRFEIFCGDLELANGFVELTDAKEQIGRFKKDQEVRFAAGLSQQRIDQRLIDALEYGLPDCSGVAVGFDRVVMLAAGAKSIKEVIGFGWDNA